MKCERIDHKADAVRLFIAGDFGNRVRQWPSLDEYRASGFGGLVVLRYAGENGGGWCQYGVDPSKVDGFIERWVSEGADRSRVYVNEAADDEGLVIQGEIMRSINYYSMRYSKVKKPMRAALAESQFHVDGLSAKQIISGAMDSGSIEMLNHIFDRWPDSVVEFSVWDRPVGDLGLNTIFWEVRNY